jgi:hypothetical protein
MSRNTTEGKAKERCCVHSTSVTFPAEHQSAFSFAFFDIGRDLMNCPTHWISFLKRTNHSLKDGLFRLVRHLPLRGLEFAPCVVSLVAGRVLGQSLNTSALLMYFLFSLYTRNGKSEAISNFSPRHTTDTKYSGRPSRVRTL